MSKIQCKRLAIIGGGAAAFFTASNLIDQLEKLEIVIFEASQKILSKVEISGGGRCNVTHNCFDIEKLSASYPRGGQELKGPLSRFSPLDTIEWFKERDVELKVEEDGRMFPVSDSSKTIVDCLKDCLNFNNITLSRGIAVKSVKENSGQFKLELSDGSSSSFDFLLIASGSSKSGHQIAESLGHTITECAPSLFTFKIKDKLIEGLAGLSFTKSSLELSLQSKKTFKQHGPLLITHWGLSGPAILKLSAYAARELKNSNYQAQLTINFLPDFNQQEIIEKFTNLRKDLATKEAIANPQFGLTKRFWERVVDSSHIPASLRFSSLSSAQILETTQTLLKTKLQIDGKGEFKEEFVTCGGISLKEIDFKHFESKLVANLYFAGEVLDIDGITGGFNFQAAWTGAKHVAKAIIEKLTT